MKPNLTLLDQRIRDQRMRPCSSACPLYFERSCQFNTKVLNLREPEPAEPKDRCLHPGYFSTVNEVVMKPITIKLDLNIRYDPHFELFPR